MKKIILILMFIILTGCTSSYNSIDKLSIISTMGIDVVDNEYVITVEILNPTKKTNKDSLDYNIESIKGSGKTISKAIDDINSKTSNELYLNHLELLIIGKTSLKYIDNIVAYFVHDNMINKDFYVFYSKDKTASNLIYNDAKDSDSEKKVANALFASFVKPDSNVIKFSDFLKNYLNPYYDSAIPIIYVDDEKTDESITLNELLITSNFKDTYVLKKDDAIIANALNNKLPSSIYTFTYEDDLYTLSNTYDKIKFTPYFIDDKPYIKINIDITSTIIESSNTSLEFDMNKINEIKEAFNKDVEERVSKVVAKLIVNRVDILGFSNRFYNEYPKYIDANGKNNLFNNLNVIVDADTFIIDFNLLKNDSGADFK